MPSPSAPAASIALVGNPNTGKSTLFSALVGIHQRTGNYPGVTVEKKTGPWDCGDARRTLIDLPGLYSLSPRSRDEMVTVDVLLGRLDDLSPPAAAICIVDASNLQRNLYLVNQVLELGLPTVVALNMLDVAAEHGISIDIPQLQRRLGVPVVAIQANRNLGLAELQLAVCRAAKSPPVPQASPFPPVFEAEIRGLAPQVPGVPKALLRRLVLDSSGYLENALLGNDAAAVEALHAARRRLISADCPVPGIETTARYAWVQRVLEGVVSQPSQYGPTASDRVDRALTHRVWGLVVFALVMLAVFQAVFAGARPLTDAVAAGVEWLGGRVEAAMPAGALQSLLVDGVLGGVGGVLTFLPQILVLFLFLAVLEDCGYMARAAYLMDGLMVRVGLSGKAFIPLLSSFACSIPGIMATRVIENERDRLTTILVIPLMTCSARLPVYTLLIAAFVPRHEYLGGLLKLQGLTLAALYALGIIAAVVVARCLKRTLLRGAPPPFVMELPSYKWPSPRVVFYRVIDRAFAFVRFAGTMILAVSIIVWAALYYPHRADAIDPALTAEKEQVASSLEVLPDDAAERDALDARLAEIDREIQGQYQRSSILGRFGRLIEPVFRPLGWDWRIGAAVIASFPAREVVVATLGVIFNLGDEPADDTAAQEQFQSRLRDARREDTGRPLFTLPVALSIMVFFALCAQCAATLAVIRQETNSWRWPLFAFGYMTALAYLGALVTYQVGSWLVL